MEHKKYAALFVRKDSAYKYRNCFDCYDADRDAKTFYGNIPCVVHPPCRAWGVMAHMAFRSKDWKSRDNKEAEKEKKLALWAADKVRENGGVFEHPAKSRIFGNYLPDVDDLTDPYGGFTILIDQYDFGHVAHKLTKLYIRGIRYSELPDMPTKRTDKPKRSIAGNIPGTKRCTQYQREYTPEELIDWIEEVLETIRRKR